MERNRLKLYPVKAKLARGCGGSVALVVSLHRFKEIGGQHSRERPTELAMTLTWFVSIRAQ